MFAVCVSFDFQSRWYTIVSTYASDGSWYVQRCWPWRPPRSTITDWLARQTGQGLPLGIPDELEFSSGGDAVGQEYLGYIVALLGGHEVGRLDYTYYEGELFIRMIEVAAGYRREGVADALLRQLTEDDPDAPVYSFGDFATAAGQAWLAHHGISRRGRDAGEADSR